MEKVVVYVLEKECVKAIYTDYGSLKDHLEMELAQYNADSPRKELWDRIKSMELQLAMLSNSVVTLSKEAHDS